MRIGSLAGCGNYQFPHWTRRHVCRRIAVALKTAPRGSVLGPRGCFHWCPESGDRDQKEAGRRLHETSRFEPTWKPSWSPFVKPDVVRQLFLGVPLVWWIALAVSIFESVRCGWKRILIAGLGSFGSVRGSAGLCGFSPNRLLKLARFPVLQGRTSSLYLVVFVGGLGAGSLVAIWLA